MKALLVVLDGIADRSQEALGRLTPLQAASMTNLDALARAGCSGHMYPLGPGICPGTDTAHWAILGYSDWRYPGRAAIEALGSGTDLLPGEVVFRVNLATTLQERGKRYVTISPAYLPEEEAGDIYTELAGYRGELFDARLVHLGGPFMLLGLSGGASTEVTDSDPLFFDIPVSPISALASMEGEDASSPEDTARELNNFIGWASVVLRSHPVITGRAAAGMTFPDHVLVKWGSRLEEVPSFIEAWGFNSSVAASGLFHAGIARLLGMKLLGPPCAPGTPPPAMAGVSRAGEDLLDRMKQALGSLEQGCDLALVHTKAPDDAAHTGRPANKVRTCEEIDAAMHLAVEAAEKRNDLLVVVTADHTTPSGGSPAVIHSGESVPVVMAGSTVRVDRVRQFDEVSCAAGGLGQLTGNDLMPLVLNFTDRARFSNSRLSPGGFPFRPRP